MRYESCRPLIVEDDQDYRTLLGRAFRKAGVPGENLQTLADGEQAFRRLVEETAGTMPPSLVVLDLHLPGRSGLEILAGVRASSSLSGVPVFLLTSSENPEHIRRAFHLRADSCFVKPGNCAELQTIVSGMLSYWHMRSRPGTPTGHRSA